MKTHLVIVATEFYMTVFYARLGLTLFIQKMVMVSLPSATCVNLLMAEPDSHIRLKNCLFLNKQ
jgi:hypothetical protein